MKVFYIIVGSLSLVLGIIGIFLPLLPTTPFLLLTAALYFRASPRLYSWLIHQKYVGSYIRNFREHRCIPLRAKILSITLTWSTLLYCVFCVVHHLLLQCLLLLLALGVSLHIYHFDRK